MVYQFIKFETEAVNMPSAGLVEKAVKLNVSRLGAVKAQVVAVFEVN